MTGNAWYLALRRQSLPWLVLALMVSVLLSVVLADPPWPVTSRFFPLSVGGLGLVIAVLELGATYVPAIGKYLSPTRIIDLGVDEGIPEAQLRKMELVGLGWILAMLVGIVLVGFQVATLVFLVMYCRQKAKASWRTTLIFSGSIWVSIFGVFDWFLALPWPKPLLLTWFGL